MKKAVLFTDYPIKNVKWSQIMDPLRWAPDVGVVKATTCRNRFELLIEGGEVNADDMRDWAHERLDQWLSNR